MSLKWLSLKRLQCQMKPTAKNGKRKGKQFYEAERFSNRISKTQTFTDLHNYLTSSVIFYILPIQNKWLKCKK